MDSDFNISINVLFMEYLSIPLIEEFWYFRTWNNKSGDQLSNYSYFPELCDIPIFLSEIAKGKLFVLFCS